MHKYRSLGFFCVLFLLFFIVKWENKCCRFFACFSSAFCIVWAQPYFVISCGFICLLSCVLMLYMYLRACLIFHSDSMLCLIVFYRQITHSYISCFSAGCCRSHLLDLSDFLWAHFRFCCLNSRFMRFTLLLVSCFVLL